MILSPPAQPRDRSGGTACATADVGCERRLVEVRERMQASLALSHLRVHSLNPTGLASIGPHTRDDVSRTIIVQCLTRTAARDVR